jgi:hypothetical protein
MLGCRSKGGSSLLRDKVTSSTSWPRVAHSFATAKTVLGMPPIP